MPSHFSHNLTAFNCQKAVQRIPPGTVRFMCHVSQRSDCPLKDMVINALCVIARRWYSPPRQSGTQDTHLHPKVTNQLSLLSMMYFNNRVLRELHEVSKVKSHLKLFSHTHFYSIIIFMKL